MPPQRSLDDITHLAAQVCRTPIALVSFVGEDRQLFKSRVGLEASEIPRALSFSAHAVLQRELFVVEDACADERFADNPLVVGAPHLRFYAGAPLVTPAGEVLGMLCVLDHQPRRLLPEHETTLRVLAGQVMAQLELLRQSRELAQSEERLRLVTETARVGLVIVDRERRYVYANRAYSKILGLPPLEVVGRAVSEVLAGVYEAQIRPRLDRAFEGERVVYELSTPGAGHEHHYSVAYEPTIIEGTTLYVVVVLTDITERKLAEAEKHRQHGELQLVLDCVPALVFYKDRDGRFLKVNRELARLVGLPPDAFVGRTDGEMGSPDGERYRRDDLEVIRSGRPLTAIEEPLYTRDGVRWLLTHKVPHRNGAGGITGVVGCAVDITERRAAEQRVRQLNRVYAVLSDINQNIVREKDPKATLEAACRIAVEKGRFAMAWIGLVKTPRSWLRLAAHAGADPQTAGLVELFLGDARESCQCAFTLLAMATGSHAVCNDIAQDPRAQPWREAALERGYRALASLPLMQAGVAVGAFNLYAGESGFFDEDELRLLDELALDISYALEVASRESARLEAESALRWRTAFFEAMVESAPDAVLVVDAQKRVILRNDRFNKLFRVPGEVEATGDNSRLLSHITALVPNADEFRRRVEHLYQHPEEAGVDEMELNDGTLLERHSSPVRDRTGGYDGRIWTFRDITERKRRQAETLRGQRMESLGTLAGGIAHDLNNVLMPILMSVDMLNDTVRTEAGRSLLATIQASAQRGADLVKQVLSFARGVEGRRVSLDPSLILREILDVVRETFPKSIQVRLTLPGTPWSVNGDPTQLHQVFLNLCLNARDAMPDGGALTIAVSNVTLDGNCAPAGPEARPGDYVLIEVNDTGTGVPAEIQERIFDPFFTTKAMGKGTGLGLSTSLGIVRSHGGFLRLRSEPGRGATFQVYLPGARREAGRAALPGEAPQPPRGEGELVLIVDDEEAIRRIVAQTLEGSGYRVLAAQHGAEAIELFLQHQAGIAAVLTDMSMPVMDGPALVAALKEIKPTVRILGSSGLVSEGSVARAVLAGLKHFVPKPYASDVLLNRLHEVLRQPPV